MVRTWDAVKIAPAIDFISQNTLDPIEWLSDPTNIVLENDHGDLSLFEYGLTQRKVYSAHYFFKSRGRQAITAARNFLDELFNTCYNINVVMGLIPVQRRAARWFSRQIGATSYGIETLRDKEYELFIITKKEFENGRS